MSTTQKPTDWAEMSKKERKKWHNANRDKKKRAAAYANLDKKKKAARDARYHQKK